MQNTSTRAIVFIGIILFSGISCNDSAVNTPLPEITTIPFIASSSYKYTWKLVELDSLDDTITFQIDTIRLRIISTNVNIGTDSNLILLEAQSVNRNIGVTKVWYKQYVDSLLEIAYENAGAVPTIFPKRQQRTALRNPAFLFSITGMNADSTIYRPGGGRVVYHYPLTKNKKWISFTSPWLQTRQVMGNELITTPAGSFVCAKIFTDNVVDFTDYAAVDGLVKRVFVPFKVEIVTESNPDGTGEMRTVFIEQELISKY